MPVHEHLGPQPSTEGEPSCKLSGGPPYTGYKKNTSLSILCSSSSTCLGHFKCNLQLPPRDFCSILDLPRYCKGVETVPYRHLGIISLPHGFSFLSRIIGLLSFQCLKVILIFFPVFIIIYIGELSSKQVTYTSWKPQFSNILFEFLLFIK